MRILFVVSELGHIDPLSIASLSAIAKRNGHKTFFCSLDNSNLTKEIELVNPDLVAFNIDSCSIDDVELELKVAKSNFDFVSIAGGPHAIFNPEDTMLRGFDACCTETDGEYVFEDFLRGLDSNTTKQIDGLITPEFTKVQRRCLIQDLDSLPFPDRDLVLSNTELGNTSKKTFFTSRGCPFQCSYCLNPTLQKMYRGKGKYVRRLSVDRVIDEIKYVESRYKLDFVKFDDDIFALRADDWLEEFSLKYSKKVGKPYNCLLRLDLVNDDIMKLLRDSGCHSITTSIDSASERVRREILGRKMTNEKIITGLNTINNYGIKTFANCILDLPTSTIDDEMETISLARKGKVDYLHYTFFVPFPGTKLAKYCVDNGIIDENYVVPKTLYGEPTVNLDSKSVRIRKNIFDLGQLAVRYKFLVKIIKFSTNLKLFRWIKERVHKHNMEHVIYLIDDKVSLKAM